jgi:hypothetical protein
MISLDRGIHQLQCEPLEQYLTQRFGKYVSHIVGGGDFLQSDETLAHPIVDTVILDVDMASPLANDSIVGQCECTSVVFV